MKRISSAVVAFVVLLLTPLFLTAQSPTEYANLRSEAEKLYAEGSYAKANAFYKQAAKLSLSPSDLRWVKFRLADSGWRAQAATESTDNSAYEEAQREFDVLTRDIRGIEDRDLVWAEVEESLGDFWWMRQNSRNWSQASPHYQNALEWWANSSDIETARARYLKIVLKSARPMWADRYYYYGGYGFPIETLDKSLKIARTPDETAFLHYLIAKSLQYQGGDVESRQRVSDEFEAALVVGKKSEWHDDALYQYAEWMASNGRILFQENGSARQSPDYVKALELFRRLTTEYASGETQYYEQAKKQIENITKPSLNIVVASVFLPGVQVRYALNWRNEKRIDLALYKVSLTQDVNFGKLGEDASRWLQTIDLEKRQPVKTWTKDTQDGNDYQPGQAELALDASLPMGAYVVAARGSAGEKARDLILVTDIALVVKTSGAKTLVYACNAIDGSPLPEASVRFFAKPNSNEGVKIDASKLANQDGVAVFEHSGKDSILSFISVTVGDREAFCLDHHYEAYAGNDDRGDWRIYAFTDRPAYRPGETVQWKSIARILKAHVYVTPSNQSLHYEVIDPRGTKVSQGKLKLNQFGGAWGALELTETMSLGDYQIQFARTGENSATIGSATLFRLEEYKLPEFQVKVSTPIENGRKKTFRLGEKIEIEVSSDYYFGGPVANATVEIVAYQNSFYHFYAPDRDYPWLYQDDSRLYDRYSSGNQQVVRKETLKTDAFGKAKLVLDSPRFGGQDIEYRIEARVIDASRREIVGRDTVRVTRQRFYVHPCAEHNIYCPSDKVGVNFKTLDANDQAVPAEGTVTVTRDFWYEIWLDPEGREVLGDELRALQSRGAFPPPVKSGEREWRLKFRGYRHDEILKQPVKTNEKGDGALNFTAEREGFYRIVWTTFEKGQNPVVGETTVWVSTNATGELGYRSGGLEIIADSDTFHVGRTAPILLTAPTNGRFVLFTIERGGVDETRLIRMEGTAKLIEIPIEARDVPNVFLRAETVFNVELSEAAKEIIVPPNEQFLSVEVKPDRDEYQPRQEGTLTITTRNADGKPVPAEVAVSLADDAVAYIQQDYAGDPRKFYYGNKRPRVLQISSSFGTKPYAKRYPSVTDSVATEENGQVAKLEGETKYIGRENETDDAEIVEVSPDSAGLPKNKLSQRGYVSASKGASLPINGREFAKEVLLKESPVQVRNDFRSTAFWRPDIVTDANGKATVKFSYPDSLTTWKAVARAASRDSQFGIGEAATRTNQPLIVRLQAPRFFVVGDTATISAAVNNNTNSPMTVAALLEATGFSLAKTDKRKSVIAPANGEARVDWTVSITQPGAVTLKVAARGGVYADAMERTYPAYDHGIEKFISQSGKTHDGKAAIALDIPQARNVEATTMTVQVTPSLAVTMLDAIPYLIDYPYGCTEQTMSRFLPAAIVAKTLKDQGLKPEDIAGKMFGGVEPATASQTHSTSKQDLAKLNDVIQRGLSRLYDFQHGDGGWGWWKETQTDGFMTGYVVWGLSLAKQAGIDVKNDVLERGADYLAQHIVKSENALDDQAWTLQALASYHRATGGQNSTPFEKAALENLWRKRDQLNAYGRALFALAAKQYGDNKKAMVLIRNLENGVKRDAAPNVSRSAGVRQTPNSTTIGTAHWGEERFWFRWSEGGVETTAFALQALLAVDPRNALVEPVMNWMVKNRRGAQWSNTRDTAMSLLALNEYLKTTKEAQSDVGYVVSVNGRQIAKREISKSEIFSTPSRFTVPRDLIRSGENMVEVTRTRGDGPLYFSAEAQFFTREEPIAPAGNEIFARRQYFKLVAQPTLLNGVTYKRVPLNDGDDVTSGERVECIVTVETKNDSEYVLLEDLKPAGLEAVQLRSGEPVWLKEIKEASVAQSGLQSLAEMNDYTGRSVQVYQELRDRKVALFIDKLPQGVWEIRYELRSETPGQFHALPVLGHAMYVPEIRCNGAEQRMTVRDRR